MALRFPQPPVTGARPAPGPLSILQVQLLEPLLTRSGSGPLPLLGLDLILAALAVFFLLYRLFRRCRRLCRLSMFPVLVRFVLLALPAQMNEPIGCITMCASTIKLAAEVCAQHGHTE